MPILCSHILTLAAHRIIYLHYTVRLRRSLHILSIYLIYICLSVCLSVCLSIYLSMHPSVHLSMDLSIYLLIHPSRHPSILHQYYVPPALLPGTVTWVAVKELELNYMVQIPYYIPCLHILVAEYLSSLTVTQTKMAHYIPSRALYPI